MGKKKTTSAKKAASPSSMEAFPLMAEDFLEEGVWEEEIDGLFASDCLHSLSGLVASAIQLTALVLRTEKEAAAQAVPTKAYVFQVYREAMDTIMGGLGDVPTSH